MDPVFLGLMLFLILGSIFALEVRNLLSAVIAVGVVGLGLAILFLLLGAPDIAITQVVVEVIVVTVLIRIAGKTESVSTGRRRDVAAALGGIVLVLALIALVVTVFAALPTFGEPKMTVSQHYLESGPEDTGATNIVTAVLLDFRGFDTLGEATVILTAVLGVLVVLRQRAKKKTAEPEKEVAHG
jgi:multisubunit Na+/H+ antiporter MnhB subunit